jgi:hypothetical protein
MKELFESLTASVKKAQFDQLLKSAQKGDAHSVEKYFIQHARCDHAAKDRAEVFDAILKDPKDFIRPAQIMNNLSRGFEFGAYFKDKPERVQDLWTVHARYPRPETAEFGAMIAAAYLRANVLYDTSFKMDFAALLKPAAGSKSLSAKLDDVQRRDSVIAVQNALVDFIREEGPKTPITSPAGMLHFLQAMEGVDAATSSIWLRKITGFDTKTTYSMKDGDISVTVARFEP